MMEIKKLSFYCKLCYEGRLSVWCYISTFLMVLLPFILQTYYNLVPNIWGAVLWGPIFYFIIINMTLRYSLDRMMFQIAVRASFLGFIQAASILLIYSGIGAWKQLGVYASFMSFFHFSEYVAIAWSNPHTLSVDSFILNHSIHYAVAAIASWLEFILEICFMPSFKSSFYIWLLGVILCTFGEIVRKTAIITAANNFTHLVQFNKSNEHKLVTHGIYAYARHPSYVGWFWWSIGTQIILCNPICLILYTLFSWRFFYDRIMLEEILLLNFFGEQYKIYQQTVPSGLPFIKGFITAD